MKLAELNEFKIKIEVDMPKLQASVELFLPNIQEMDRSAAVVFSIPSRNVLHLQSPNYFMKDIVGLVVLLGTVDSIKHSRILSEYLGIDQMLAVVTRSFSFVNEIQMYEPNAEVDKRDALYAEAAALGKSIDSRFLVISLEDIRPYSGGIEVVDPQRKLVLPNPRLAIGGIPPGFIGYAVNLINLDMNDMQARSSFGHGLRETLFYNLFGELQVYETRKEMFAARACIKHGAVSLDGGILKENGIISLGFGYPEVCFAVEAVKTDLLLSFEEGKQVIKREESQYVLREMNESIMTLNP